MSDWGIPGTEYSKTRHNVGFMAVDFLAGDDASWKREKNALTTSMNMSGYKIIFAKPQTYMNNSGIAVRQLMTFYKIPLDNLIVIHDELDLKPGATRDKVGGGSAGHNGIKSIDSNVGAGYMRIRIGIGHPRDYDLMTDVADWVLGKISPDDMKKINDVIGALKVVD